MNVFTIDTHNEDQNIPTDKLRQMTTSPTNISDISVCFVIMSGGVGQTYTAITHWMNTLSNHDPLLQDKLFVVECELINNHGHVVEVENTVFTNQTTTAHIPTAVAILAVITSDPNIDEMGPYVSGDSNAETVKVQKICPVPRCLGGSFLHHEGVTGQTYFKIIYPLITTYGREAVYASLTKLFRTLSISVLRQHHPPGPVST